MQIKLLWIPVLKQMYKILITNGIYTDGKVSFIMLIFNRNAYNRFNIGPVASVA